MKRENLLTRLSHLLLGINYWVVLSLLVNCTHWDESESIPLSAVKGNDAATHFVTMLNSNPGKLEEFQTFLDGNEPIYDQIVLKEGLDYGLYYFVPYQKSGVVQGAFIIG